MKEEGALENHASVFETHSSIKMQWFFFGIKFLLLLKNTPNFKVKRKHGYVEECMILKYVNPEVGRGKSRSLQPKSIFFLGKCVSITHWASFGTFLHLEAFYGNIEKYEETALPNI